MADPDIPAESPKKKRQHYVPKFYLRNFSFDGGNRLHLLHVETLRAIPRIGLKEQCHQDYFYGHDAVVENALQDMEGAAAKVFQAIITERRLPDRATEDDFVFRSFVCMQWGRTKSHAENSEALFSKALKTVYSPEWRAAGIPQDEIDQLEFGTTYPGAYSLGMAAEMIPFLGDLETKLVVSGTLGEFVTSDTPVVMINPFYLGRFPGGITGFNVRGLIILVPISPQLLAVLYDAKCYRVGSPGKRVVQLASHGDLVALNNFQCLNAANAIYFQSEAMATDHLSEFATVIKLREADRGVVIEAFSEEPGDNSSLLHTYHSDLRYRPKFSFLSLVRKKRGQNTAVSQLEERNPELSELFQRYGREVQAGQCRRGFLEYCARLGFARRGIPPPEFIRGTS